MNKYFVFIFFLASCVASNAQQKKVVIKEELKVIPTYEIESPDANPRFYEGRSTQGAQGKVYPYPMYDRLSNKKVDKTYRLVTIENEYVEITVLPELGGRIYTAFDKVNKYDFLYRNKVIKPALIGTIGAWVSGGNEFNFPHHHKANTMLPANYFLSENADGSATLWLNELDRRHGLHLTMSMTLYPGKSYLEVKINPSNPTPFEHSFLYWANPAVHVDSTYQVIFPPNVQYVTYHAKSYFTEWPISQSPYRDDLEIKGADISWWKNIISPESFFSWNYEADYFGGYNHGKDAGIVYIANHHLAPGMKYFTWGNGTQAMSWDKVLTDNDGPYLELMAGAFSDNQPDYSFIKPNESKFVTQYWFPIHNLQGMEYANIMGALNIFTEGNSLSVKMITTSKQTDAKLKIMNGQQVVVEKVINIAPDSPYSFKTTLSSEIYKTNLTISLTDKNGLELLYYKPKNYPKIPMPKVVKPPVKPQDIATVEELYFEGSRLDQFYNSQIESKIYYEEALKRDPLNSQVNTKVGIEYCKKFMWAKAEECLIKAISRISSSYVHPKNTEAYYYLAFAQMQQNKNKEAYDNYYKAAWDEAMESSAYFQLANMDCKNGNYLIAKDHITRSLDYNRKNLLAIALLAYIDNQLNNHQSAQLMLEQAVLENPINQHLLNQLAITYQLTGNQAKKEQTLKRLNNIMGNNSESYLELATFYFNCGAYKDGIDLLSRVDISINPKGSTYPIIYYYLGYYYDHTGQKEMSAKYYSLAAIQSSELCFPYRLETLTVLKEALIKNPNDGNCAYYLGNLVYDNQPGEAMKYWNIAASKPNPTYHVFRNLAYGYNQMDKDYATAIPLMEKAIALNNMDARLFYEMDVLYENNNTDIKIRLKNLEKNKATVKFRTDATTRLVIAYIQSGQYDKATSILSEYHFSRWEGGGNLRTYYEDVNLLKGIVNYEKKKYSKALECFRKADEYPENMETSRPAKSDRFGQIYFYIGLSYEALNKKTEAKKYYQKAVEFEFDNTPYLYYQGLAYQKLGEKDKAKEVWEKLQAYSETSNSVNFFAKFDEKNRTEFLMAHKYYILGLSELSKQNKTEAIAYFKKALEYNPNYYWAKSGLSHLVKL
ncbi:MAG: DUF5107 domain-containing protein [Mariniphaga sp.]|nr:DUF5107 domain-containing protein [Mariniphaga sp.]